MKPAPRSLLALFFFASGCGPAMGADPAEHPKPAEAPRASTAHSPAPADAARAPEASKPPEPKGASQGLEAPKSFDLKAIDEYVARYAGEKGFVGISLAIMKNGNVVLAK